MHSGAEIGKKTTVAVSNILVSTVMFIIQQLFATSSQTSFKSIYQLGSLARRTRRHSRRRRRNEKRWERTHRWDIRTGRWCILQLKWAKQNYGLAPL